MGFRIAGWTLALGLGTAVLASETVRAWVLLFMLFVGFAGFVRFLFRTPLGWIVAGLTLGGVFGCGDGE